MDRLLREAWVGEPSAARGCFLWLPGYGMDAAFYSKAASILWKRLAWANCFITMNVPKRAPGEQGARWKPYVDSFAQLVLQKASLSPTVIVGHSFGTVLAVLTAIEHLNDSVGLVLVEPVVQTHRAFAKRVVRNYQKSVLTAESYTFNNVAYGVRRVSDLDNYPQWALQHHVQGVGTLRNTGIADLFEDYLAQYPLAWNKIRTPTLIVSGKQSGLGTRVSLRLLQSKLKGSKLILLEDAAHWIFNEADLALVRSLEGFCRDSFVLGDF